MGSPFFLPLRGWSREVFWERLRDLISQCEYLEVIEDERLEEIEKFVSLLNLTSSSYVFL